MNGLKASVLGGIGVLGVLCMTMISVGAPADAETPVAQPAPAVLAKPAVERPAAPPAAWPKTLPDAAAESAAAAKPASQNAWTPEEIATARARCDTVLKGLSIVVAPEAPVREGACGAPAPVRLVSIGKSPQVSFSPPALVTCDLAAALHTWVQRDLQPLARKHLGSGIVVVQTMSDYACRNVYGHARGRLSEHSRVNALDIRGFVTARALGASVLAGWGPTARDVRAQTAGAAPGGFVTTIIVEPDAAAPSVAVAAEVQTHKPQAPAPRAVAAADPLGDFARALLKGGASKSSYGLGLASPQDEAAAAPSWLGGPKPKAKTPDRGPVRVQVSAPAPEDGQSAFLRAAHLSACRLFGTVLGPEANNAHRNHFHVDMAPRPRGNFCE